MTGSEEFNEVFLEDVRHPARAPGGTRARRLGDRQHDAGARARHVAAPARHPPHAARTTCCAWRARSATARRPRRPTRCVRQRIAQHVIEVEITRLNNWRTLTRLQKRLPLGPESSFIKLFWSEMSQRMHDTVMDAARAARPAAGSPARTRSRAGASRAPTSTIAPRRSSRARRRSSATSWPSACSDCRARAEPRVRAGILTLEVKRVALYP